MKPHDYKAYAEQLLGELLEAKATIAQLTAELERHGQPTLSRVQAREVHRKLGKLGFSSDEQYLIAERTLGRQVKSFTTLTETEANNVMNAAERVARVRQPGPISPSSDEDALAILGEAA